MHKSAKKSANNTIMINDQNQTTIMDHRNPMQST